MQQNTLCSAPANVFMVDASGCIKKIHLLLNFSLKSCSFWNLHTLWDRENKKREGNILIFGYATWLLIHDLNVYLVVIGLTS